MRPVTVRISRARTIWATSVVALLAAALGAGTLVSANAEDDTDTDERVAQYAENHKTRYVMVDASTPKLRSKVASLPLDVTEHGTPKGVGVILHGSRDAQVLRDAGFSWTVEIADLDARARENARADAAYAKQVEESPLPSGRTSYRRLKDYNADLSLLHKRYPKLTKPITLRHKSVEGRSVNGIEITTNAANVRDGKPVFLLMGAHHAREWPSSEHAIEYAFDLLQNYTDPAGEQRAQAIVKRTRTIVVPVVNVDGFKISRNAEPLGDFSLFDYEMKRKNCTISETTPEQYTPGTCEDNPAGRLRGTDLNRNYPGFWGGPGASPNWSSDTFRGDDPGSEPETRNIRNLVSHRQVTTLISNHTFSNLVLRPPSLLETGWTPDEPQYKALGAEFAAHNEYRNQASFQLYDTSGSTEDWSYWNTGGYGFTFEIGPDEFHPPFEDGVVAEYLGLEPAAGAGLGGNREAYYQASLATLKRSMHSTIVGTAPKNRLLEIRKHFVSATSPVIRPDGSTGPQRYYEDTLVSSLTSTGGSFSWAVNPSTRPLIAGRWGRDPEGPPQEEVALTNPDGIPAVGESEQTTFTIQGPDDGVDNAVATVEIGWPGPEAVDWDVYILGPDGEPVSDAATLDNPETATLIDPVPGEYTVIVENFDGGDAASDWAGRVTFRGPDPADYTGLKESWSFTCTNPESGRMLASRDVVVDRGETVRLGEACKPRKR
ncbi:MAG: M14 family zinc carboxypeptidase [Nocardioidaceae bacterium]